MSRTLKCGFTFCGETFPGTLQLPNDYFDEVGKPIRHLLNSRLSAQPAITYGDSSVLPDPIGDPGRSLIQEVMGLRAQVASMAQAMKGLVELLTQKQV
jgi:hypothetical protein